MRLPPRELVAVMGGALATVLALATSLSLIRADAAWLPAVALGTSFLVVTVMATLLFPLLFRQSALPTAHTVAIVGFPKSGKTTLLTSLFGEVFAQRIEELRVLPRGTSVIERVNRDLNLLETGRALGPTTDQDRFAYRADITVAKFPFLRTYKVEFGDFPGQDSEMYALRYGPWLHTTEFFKWVAECDALVFVVDLARYLARPERKQEYVASVSTAIRAAWQHFLDANEHRASRVRRQPLVLAFTKADLLGVGQETEDWDIFEVTIAGLGFSADQVPPLHRIDPALLDLRETRVKRDFADLINYLQHESRALVTLFVSSFGLCEGRRIGLRELLRAVLPR